MGYQKDTEGDTPDFFWVSVMGGYMKFLLVLLLSLFLLPNQVIANEIQPDKVIKKFFDETRNLDLEGMLGCFATDEYVQNYDFRKFVGSIGAVILDKQLLPNRYPIYKELNKQNRKATVIEMIHVYILRMVLDEDMRKPQKINLDQIDDIMKDLDPAPLKNLKLLLIKDPLESFDQIVQKSIGLEKLILHFLHAGHRKIKNSQR